MDIFITSIYLYRLTARSENYKETADGQVEENRRIRDEVDKISAQLTITEKDKKHVSVFLWRR